MTHTLETLHARLDQLDAQAFIAELFTLFPTDRIALASSLGLEDQALTDMILKAVPAARIFVLDTGRHFEETYQTIDATMMRYGMRYEILFPDAKAVEEMVAEKGPNLFYESVDNRKRCCNIRKVEPLKRVLATVDGWITGLRAAQSVTRTGVAKVEWDEGFGIFKFNPLADWSEEDVKAYVREHKVPVNPLHDRGFPSIGCAPCTRAIEPGEDIRAGRRWWWEKPEHKECGLHKR